MQQPDEDTEPSDDPSTVEVAIGILHAIAEDPILRSSYRQRAREHLRDLHRAARRAVRSEIGGDDEAEEL